MEKSFDRLITSVGKYSQQHPEIKWVLSFLWLILIGWLAFFWNLGNIGLIDETEPLFVEAARQMVVTGDWITPYFNGETRFDKPALIYWLMAVAYKIVGVNEWGARLPSALAAFALAAMAFYTLRYFGFPSPATLVNQQQEKEEKFPHHFSLWLSAWIGAALIALHPLTIVWARTGVSDMLLSACMGMGLLSFFLGYARKNEPEKSLPISDSRFSISPKFWYLSFYIFIALAVLTKGPVGIVLPVLIIAAFLLYLGNWREVLAEAQLLIGSLIFCAIALPWYVLVILRNGNAYIDSFFGYHNIERFTQVVNRHSAPWYFYFLVVLVGFFPWSVYLPLAIARLKFWQRRHWQNSPRATHLGLFAFFWFAVIFGFFTIAVTKLPSYVLPLMPATAILVALLFGQQISLIVEHRSLGKNPGLFWSGIFNVVLLLAVACVILYSPNLIGYDPAVPNLYKLVERSNLPIRGFFIWGLTSLGAVILLLRRHWQPFLVAVNLAGFLAFLIFVLTPGYFLVDEARQLPLRELATVVTQVRQPGEELIMVGFKKPSLVFYTKQSVNFFKSFEEAFAYIEQPANPQRNSSSVLLLTQSNKIDPVILQRLKYQKLADASAYELLRVSQKLRSNG